MKKIAYFIILVALLSVSSCSMFELDNYEAPKRRFRE
jgi:hypothetical protein